MFFIFLKYSFKHVLKLTGVLKSAVMLCLVVIASVTINRLHDYRFLKLVIY
jgi:hypothetical protein